MGNVTRKGLVGSIVLIILGLAFITGGTLLFYWIIKDLSMTWLSWTVLVVCFFVSLFFLYPGIGNVMIFWRKRLRMSDGLRIRIAIEKQIRSLYKKVDRKQKKTVIFNAKSARLGGEIKEYLVLIDTLKKVWEEIGLKV